jgi:ParB family chromosome partitioning protein
LSKADTLGPAPAFGAARSARRAATQKAIGGDGAPQETVTELPVTLISENPDNPRNHLRDIDSTVETVRSVGVLLPIVVATVEAYLRERPDRANDLDEGAKYLVVDGHRRLEASRRVGLATIPVRVDNARVATDESLLEAAFIANYHRDDMTDLEEAHALQQLVEYYGSQTKASKRLGIAQSTLASKLSLLKLAPELQKDLMTGERKVEHVRNLGKLSPEEQKAKADERAETARRRAASVAEPTGQPSSGPADYHGVIIPEPAADSPEPETRPAVFAPESRRSAAAVESVPEPRSVAPSPVAAQEDDRPKRLPYEDAVYCVHHMHRKMDVETFAHGARVWLKVLKEEHPEHYQAVYGDLEAP